MIIESLLDLDDSTFDKLSKDKYNWVNGKGDEILMEDL